MYIALSHHHACDILFKYLCLLKNRLKELNLRSITQRNEHYQPSYEKTVIEKTINDSNIK